MALLPWLSFLNENFTTKHQPSDTYLGKKGTYVYGQHVRKIYFSNELHSFSTSKSRFKYLTSGSINLTRLTCSHVHIWKLFPEPPSHNRPHTIENMICCTNYQIPKIFANISPLPLRKRMPRICWGLAPKFIKHTMMRHFFSFAAWCNGYVRFNPQYDNFGTFTSCSEGNSLQRRKSRTILGRKKQYFCGDSNRHKNKNNNGAFN